MKPFRFAARAASGVVGVQDIQETARFAESVGFDAIVFPDHLIAQHAPIPLLTAAALATEHIQVCPYVLNVDLRHPAVIAQELATLDVLSEGRLEIGLGAGWNRAEYVATGIPFEPVGVRVSRVREAVTVLKGCFGGEPFSFAGKHYTITDHDGQPKPFRRQGPPILLGGGGRKMLALAAELADTVGLAPRVPVGGGGVFFEPSSITFAATSEKVAWVRESAGERFDRLELSTYASATHPSAAPVTVTDNALAVARRWVDDIRSRTGTDLTVDEYLDSPHVWIGTIDQLSDKCLSLRERLGISHFMLGPPHVCAELVERLAGE
ncbi:TIGR03621 family F420-dependent LLM class oxidoreductase [Nocardia sp. NBC_00508]|uniref:TIGR03621 family F420-dependent LLM class oxidoreductase n=1 Tax=Nocardia sp. NBC_00508 TaxID=2975992 RepID=UPI002E8228CE|nr:TIGR03621 family F420-dependent LLM class oxidoreductase [Nocardia sp. NBC_00508]WUD67345.1 TIGR03621 family F420-dependent LLM class oxidoreductase [Nocardia sp. NBC_00508]